MRARGGQARWPGSGPVERVRARGGSDAGDGGRVSVRAGLPRGRGTPGAGSACRCVVIHCGRGAPGGVDSVMSPQVALCEVGRRESSAAGFRRAGLAWRKRGWIVLRWARITQAGLSACRPRLAPGSVRAAPGIGREPARGRR